MAALCARASVLHGLTSEMNKINPAAAQVLVGVCAPRPDCSATALSCDFFIGLLPRLFAHKTLARSGFRPGGLRNPVGFIP